MLIAGAAILYQSSPTEAADSFGRPRKVIVLQGINSSSNCTDDPRTPEDERMVGRVAWVRETLQGRDVAQYVQYAEEDFFYFDYGAGYCPDDPETPEIDESKNPNYSKIFTCVNGVARSSNILDLLITRILQINDETQIDIIGHSMGGVIAAYWVATHQDDSRLKNIHSVITFDSPLQGLEGSKVTVGKLLTCLGDDTAWNELHEDSDVMRTIQERQPDTIVPLVTIRAVGDISVTDSRATLPGEWRDLHRPMGSHSELWSDPIPDALRLVAFAVSTDLHDDRDIPADAFSEGWKEESRLLSIFIKQSAKLAGRAIGSSITFEFEGSSISLVFYNCYGGSEKGTAQVRIINPDGTIIREEQIPKTCRGSTVTSRREFSNLDNGQHAFILTITGNGPFDFDAFEVKPNKRPAVEGMHPPVDIYFLVDLSGSFTDDLPLFKAQAPGIIATLKASNPNTRFGLSKFEDYPISPFGSASLGDKAYERLVDLTFDTDLVLDTISGLFTRSGADAPQSQLPALFQTATGAGQDLSGAGFPEATIPPGQQANFRDGATKLILLWTDASFHRPGDPGAIPYPGPSFNETVDAILALDPPKVIGISSGPFGIPDLKEIAAATDALAPPDGVDCDGDGIVDIPGGEPLVCSIAPSGEGIGEAITALVEAGTEQPPALMVDIDIKPGSDPNSINCNSEKEVIAVAILTTEDFDATTVDHNTVTFEGTVQMPMVPQSREPERREEDADGDGDTDLVFHFRLGETDLTCDSTEGMLMGETFDGQIIEGSDAVRMIDRGRAQP